MIAEFTEVVAVQSETIENMNTYNESQKAQFEKEIANLKDIAAGKDVSLGLTIDLLISLRLGRQNAVN